MEEIRTVVAVLNDEQKLNDRKSFEIIIDLVRDIDPDSITVKEVVQFLTQVSESGYKERASQASRMLDTISEADFPSYESYLSGLEKDGVDVITFLNPEFPRRLWWIENPPLCLFVRGDINVVQDGIAVVGTRAAEDHRIEFIKDMSGTLAQEGHTIVSGLANGIDEAGHEAAVDSGCKTAAVLPGDIQSIRPSSNENLGERIPKHGALISEVTNKVGIHRGRFVKRNRITSGLSKAVVIGASKDSGGTVHQAKFSQEQGRPRFIYEPDEDDGQTPDKVKDFGFIPFSSTPELKSMLNQDFSKLQATDKENYYLDDF